MFEPTQREVDNTLEQSMAMFQRAEVGEVPALEPRKPGRILLVLDGFAQDELGIGIVDRLRQRLGCQVAILDLGTAKSTSKHISIPDWSEQLDPDSISPDQPEPYEKILAAVSDWQAELALVPCPFGRDFESIGSDSTGTVIDVLLARSPVPVLTTRAPFHPKGDVFSRMRIMLFGENEAAAMAARWSVGLVHPEGSLELVLIVEEEFYENVREAMNSIKPDVKISIESLENALVQTHARLHVALQRSAAKLGFDYSLNVQPPGERKPLRVDDPASTPPLLVLAHERTDSASQGHVSSYIRNSPNPVLIIHVD
ncbi:hypothetical protein [Bythopirellula goksoeyrii]|uniref:Universal stress protein family protein n=1 Tax=Bythopirellula goksoeyrii TaxID=1400387 RepID=A0A5B9Q786_9BACT|nr:hypothetical protein [Bythopirellula goksoeyrii]QEG34874.1 hypothetical protein Pr1d_21620 [Bythopirellula goksoeyrii]